MKSRQIILVSLLVAAWLISLVAIHALSAPAIGAAIVEQIDSSNASYFWAMSASSGSTWVSVGVSALFIFLIYQVVKSKK